jgi:hypothetical protein
MFDRFGGCKNAYNAEEEATLSSADFGGRLLIAEMETEAAEQSPAESTRGIPQHL